MQQVSMHKQILGLLQQKADILLEIEQVTGAMLLEHGEMLIGLAQKRQNLFAQLRQPDAELRELCAQDENVQQILNHARLPETVQEQQLYDASQQVCAVANRLMEEQPNLHKYLENERETLRTKLQKLNAGSQSVAGHYRKVIMTGLQEQPKKFSKNF